jgi:hypothetical protein
VIEADMRGLALMTWPLVFRPLHDALLEDALDKAERDITGMVANPNRWSSELFSTNTHPIRRLGSPRTCGVSLHRTRQVRGRGLAKGWQIAADQSLQSSSQAVRALPIRTTPHDPGPATTVFSTVAWLKESPTSESRKC